MLRHLKRYLVLLAVTIAAVVAVSSVESDAATFAPPDSNGYVPEYYSSVGTCYDGQIGWDQYLYQPKASYGPHVHYIVYDVCEMRRLGASSAGWARLKAHERAHARGLAHYEGSPRTNPAYYPTVDLY